MGGEGPPPLCGDSELGCGGGGGRELAGGEDGGPGNPERRIGASATALMAPGLASASAETVGVEPCESWRTAGSATFRVKGARAAAGGSGGAGGSASICIRVGGTADCSAGRCTDAERGGGSGDGSGNRSGGTGKPAAGG